MSTPPPPSGYRGYQPYPQQPPGPPAQAAPAQSKNMPGRISLIAGIIVALVLIAAQVISIALPLMVDQIDAPVLTVMRSLNVVENSATGVFGLIAVVSGGIGLAGGSKPRGAAGAGMAIGIFGILSTLVTFVVSAAISAM